MEELLETVEPLLYPDDDPLPTVPRLCVPDVLPLYAGLPDVVEGRLYVGVVPDVFLLVAFDFPEGTDADVPLLAATLLAADELDVALLTDEDPDVPVTLFLLTLLLVPMPRRAVVLLVNTLLSPCVSCLGPYQRSLVPLPP